MKHLLLLISCLMVYLLPAQDTIRFTNGEMKSVKVNEVGVNEVKFNRFDLQDGPTYVVNKSDVFLIKYSNGQIDTFKVNKQSTTVVLSEPVRNSVPINEQVQFNKGSVSKDSKLLRSKDFIDLINNHPDEKERTNMLVLLSESNAHRTKQHQFGFIGAGLAISTFFVCTASGDGGIIAVGVLVGTGIMISSQVISKINKSKRLKKLKDAVDLYNK